MDLNININDLISNQIQNINKENLFDDVSILQSSLAKDELSLALLLDKLQIGDIISGEVINSINNELTLLTDTGAIINAKVNIEENTLNIGDTAKFTLKSINNKLITLSHLKHTSDISENPAITKALSQANLSATRKNTSIVKHLLDNNLSVDKQNLHKIVKDSYLYKELSVKDLITLHKNNIPINKETASQFILYKNNNHKISDTLGSLLDSINKINHSNTIIDLDKLKDINIKLLENFIIKESHIQASKTVYDDKASDTGKIINSLNKALNNMNTLDDEDFFSYINSKTYKDTIIKAFMHKFTISAKEFNKSNIVNNYQHLLDDINKIKDIISKDNLVLEQTLKSTTDKLENNLDFMKLINNAVNYLQIPLNINQEIRHADLYVYKNKNKDTDEDFKVLLHLEMPSLGNTNIHITLNNTSIHAQFFLDDNLSRKLISKNLHLIKSSLNNLGYSFTADVKEKYEDIDFVDRLNNNYNKYDKSRYSFDVRA